MNSEVVDAFLSNQLVDFSKVISFGDVSKGSVASFSDDKVLLLKGHLCNMLPVCLSLGSQLKRLEDLNSSVEAFVFEGSAELNEGFIEVIGILVGTIVNKDDSLTLGSLDGFNVSLNLVHGNLIGLLNTVPNAEIVSVLSDNNVGVWNPVDELAVVQKSLLLLFLDVVEMKLSPLVSEQELVTTWVQLEIVDFAVVVDGCLDLVETQVLDTDGQGIEQVGDDLCGLSAPKLLVGVVQTRRNHIWAHILGSAGSDDLVETVLNDRELSGVEDHADIWVGEVILLVTTSSPWEFRNLAGLSISQKESAVSGGNQVSESVDVDLGDLVALGRLKNESLRGVNLLDDDLRKGDVGELKSSLVPGLLEAHIEDVDGTTQRSDTNPGAILLPADCSHRVVVFDLLAANLVPLWSLRVEVVDVEPVEVTNDGGLTARVEGSAGEFLDSFILGVVESLEAVTGRLIECNLSVISSRKNMGAPCKSVRNGAVLELGFGFGLNVESDH